MTLGHVFNKNFKVIYKEYCFEDYNIDTEIELFDFGYEDFIEMRIAYLNYFENKPPDKENIYACYTVTFPVSLKYAKKLDIEFMPNGIFEIDDIPFSGTWNFFIEDIQGVGQGSGNEFIKYVLNVRDCYIEILKNIKCDEVIIWTDAYYRTEEEILFCPIPQKKNTLLEFQNYLTTLDNVKFYKFLDALFRRVEIQSQTNHYLNVAFIDQLQDKY